MDKRTFLQVAAVSTLIPGATIAVEKPRPPGGPTLLTISGDIKAPNRGGIDKALDQLMVKHGVQFQKARTFDFVEISRIPVLRMRPTIEYDTTAHRLEGPELTGLLALAGAPAAGDTRVSLRAIDGYRVELTLAEVRDLGFIVATHLDGKPLPLGGLGPLWAIVDADRIPELAAKPVTERFAQCPWALYSVHVKDARG
ncbi:molybdopterin-dependent oxidoreductase [Propionivibrio sp.]|uniref:molybdopterin-dependent oxidoreductase n=1 Tax=Propionivibrio sp. TaxID=2212460 RepID=UPI002600DE02|nr:molybdopterin-dependent oxidoreductase [Propionivibrio sp.]MBK7355328.1 molybdopterin-dependent oxidoreductase [Propionivibrio sp.]